MGRRTVFRAQESGVVAFALDDTRESTRSFDVRAGSATAAALFAPAGHEQCYFFVSAGFCAEPLTPSLLTCFIS